MKLIGILIGILTIISGQAKQDGYIIKGELSGAPENEWIFLTNPGQTVYYDSVRLHRGKFEFRGKMDTPELRSITYFKDPAQRIYGWDKIFVLPLYLENSEIRMNIPFSEIPSKLDKRVPESLHIEGSASHDLYVAYTKSVEPFNLKYDELFDRYRQVYYYKKGTEEDVFQCIKDMDATRDEVYRCGVDFIREHADSPVALYVAGKLNVTKYGRAEAQKVAELFPAGVKTGETGQKIEKMLLGKPLYINDLMPDILVWDTDLQAKKLSECVKKGRYTLVELWASWCGPCRADIPHLKETYQRYHDKGFDIVSISIDDDTAKWQKAVSEEQMPWLQACGAEGKSYDKKCMKAYGVSGVPSGFLVGPDGKIVHMSARGGWLNLKLAELFGKN